MVTCTPLARKLWRIFSERPGRYTFEELRRELRSSKSAIIRAAAELEEAGIISLEAFDG